MSRHLTWRFWLYAAASALLLLIGLVQPPGESSTSFIALAPFVTVIVLSIISGWWRSVEVTRVSLGRLRIIEGDEVALFVDLRCPHPVAVADFELQLPAALEPVSSCRITQPIAGDSRLRFDLRATRWGAIGPEFLNVVTRDRFALTECIQQFPLTNLIHVHPPSQRIQAILHAERTRSTIGDHRSIARGPGLELAEVRNHQPTDPIGRIHPVLSMRRGRPMVVDRHTERATDVILYIDAVQDVGSALDSTLRSTIAAAIGLQQRHFRSMDRIGILNRSTGVQWLPPSLGRRAGHLIVDALLSSAVMRDRPADLETLPYVQLDGRSLILALTPLYSEVVVADLARLRNRGHPVAVIAIDRPLDTSVDATARRILRIDNEINRRQLRELGVTVLPWETAGPLDPVLRRAVSAGRGPGRQRGALPGVRA